MLNHNEKMNATSVQVLTKESTSTEIKTYFKKVLELKTIQNRFPVNLDDVWALVYVRRDLAVRALEKSPQFMQGADYQVFRQNAEKSERGRPNEEYHLSVECLEYFIARKIRPVFEVYRKVFHKSINRAVKEKPTGRSGKQSGSHITEQAYRMLENELLFERRQSLQLQKENSYYMALCNNRTEQLIEYSRKLTEQELHFFEERVKFQNLKLQIKDILVKIV